MRAPASSLCVVISQTTEFTRLAVVVPTRNRPKLAAAAVKSLVDPQVPNVTILVSDNSTAEADTYQLEAACEAFSCGDLRYARPPKPLPMAAHWQWAMTEALADAAVSHVMLVTDRLVFKPRDLADLLRLVVRRPSEVIAYNIDKIDDEHRPARLVQWEWTGQVLRISTSHLLKLAARGEYSNCVPHALNSLMPRATIDDLMSRHGSVFASVAPDFCFAYRCLDNADYVTFWDRSPLVAHALAESNGASYSRGRITPAYADFIRELGPDTLNSWTPIPQLLTASNALFNEYCFVRSTSSTGRMPPVHRRWYLAAARRDLLLLDDPESRADVRHILESHGWNTWAALLCRLERLGHEMAFCLTHPMCVIDRMLWKRHRGTRLFPSVDDAIRAAQTEPRPRSPRLGHLRRYLYNYGLRVYTVDLLSPHSQEVAVRGDSASPRPSRAFRRRSWRGRGA